MTTRANQKQATLDAILDAVASRLEAALDLVAASTREDRLAELGALCTDAQVLAAAALRLAAR